MEWKEWCMLCAKEKVHLLKVEAPKSRFNILNVIENYLQISFNFQDDCPSKICLSCVQMLVSFENFTIELNKAYSMFRELSDTLVKLEDHRKIKLKYGIIEEENEDESDILSLDIEVFEKKINRINAQDNIKENIPEKFEDPQIMKSTLYQNLPFENLNDELFLDNNSTSNSDDELIADDFSQMSEYEMSEYDDEYIASSEDSSDRDGKNKNKKKYITKLNNKKNSIKLVQKMELLNEKYLCEICSFEAKNKNALYKHKRHWHTTERTFVCEVCGKSFKLGEGLKEHLNKVHKVEPVNCDICNKEFQNPIRLRMHKNQYKNNKYKNSFTCLESKKRFHTSNEVSQNNSKECILCYLNLRPFQCRFCEKKFNNKNNTKKHEMKTHKKEYEDKEEKNKEMGNRIRYKMDKCPNTNALIEMVQKLKNDGWSGSSSSSSMKKRKC